MIISLGYHEFLERSMIIDAGIGITGFIIKTAYAKPCLFAVIGNQTASHESTDPLS